MFVSTSLNVKYNTHQLKMEVSEMNSPSRKKKTLNALKADRKVHRVTFNPNNASIRETLNISVPKLDDRVGGCCREKNEARRELQESTRVQDGR